jgi:N-acetylglucosamine kinase-like BadF-type ATPase
MTAGFLGIDVGLSGARAAVISSRGKTLAQAKLEGATGAMSPPRLASLVDRTVRIALKGRPRILISWDADTWKRRMGCRGDSPLLP